MPEPEKKNISADFLAGEGGEQPPAGEPPAEGQPPVEPAVEPEEKPPEVPGEKPAEEKPEAREPTFYIPDEELKEVYDEWGSLVEGEPPVPLAPQPQPAPAPATLPPQGLPPDIPADVLQITPQQFMPQGQEFDPAEVYMPGTASSLAAMRAQAEQTRRITLHERERYEQERIMRQQMESIQDFVAQKKREGVPDAAVQGFLREITDNREPISLQFLWNAKVLEKRQAMRKAQGARPPVGGEGTPAPVTGAPRVVEKPASQAELDKEVNEMLGSKQKAAI